MYEGDHFGKGSASLVGQGGNVEDLVKQQHSDTMKMEMEYNYVWN